jgi:hypothetical protein
VQLEPSLLGISRSVDTFEDSSIGRCHEIEQDQANRLSIYELNMYQTPVDLVTAGSLMVGLEICWS